MKAKDVKFKIIICVSHTAGCGVPDTTTAPENNVAICPGGEKKKKY